MNPYFKHLRVITLLIFALLTPLFARADLAVHSPPADTPHVETSIDLPAVPHHFEHARTGWLDIAYTPQARERVTGLLRSAEEIRATLSAQLGAPVLDQIEVRIARTPEEMAAVTPLHAPPPAYASGVAYPALRLIALTMEAPRSIEATDLDEVLRHELAHLALADATGGDVPRWFNEGFAVYASGESRFARLQALWDATLSETLLPLSEIDRSFPADSSKVTIAYAESADFVRFLLREPDRLRFEGLIKRVRNGEPFYEALSEAYGVSLKRLEYEWHEEIASRYTVLPLITGGSLFWVLAIGGLAYAFVKRRRHAKETIARWGREEAEHDQLRARYLAEMQRHEAPRVAIPAPVPGEPPLAHPSETIAPPVSAIIEHDGEWHTIH